MKKNLTILGLAVLLIAAAPLTSCQKAEVDSPFENEDLSEGTRASSSVLPYSDIIDWSKVDEYGNSGSSNVIKSMRVTNTNNHVYLMLKVDASKVKFTNNKSHKLDYYMWVSLRDNDNGNSTDEWYRPSVSVVNMRGWLFKDGKPKFTPKKSSCVKYPEVATVTEGGKTYYYYVIPFPRADKDGYTCPSKLLQKDELYIGVWLEPSYCNNYTGSSATRVSSPRSYSPDEIDGPTQKHRMYYLKLKKSSSTPAPKKLPEMGSGSRVATFSGITDLSGLCLSKDKDFLWGICNGNGELYKISFKGSLSPVAEYGDDTEDICIDPSGNLYIAVEDDTWQSMLKAKSPYTSASKVMALPEAETKRMSNNGLEGITWYNKGNGGKGTIYIGSQSEPFSNSGRAYLWEYEPSSKTLTRKRSLKSLTKYTASNGSTDYYLNEVGGMDYDAKNDWLWVVDSDKHNICLFNGEATKLLKVYYFGDKISTGNTESICVDHDRNCVWLADDSSNSKLYKLSFSNLNQ